MCISELNHMDQETPLEQGMDIIFYKHNLINGGFKS